MEGPADPRLVRCVGECLRGVSGRVSELRRPPRSRWVGRSGGLRAWAEQQAQSLEWGRAPLLPWTQSSGPPAFGLWHVHHGPCDPWVLRPVALREESPSAPGSQVCACGLSPVTAPCLPACSHQGLSLQPGEPRSLERHRSALSTPSPQTLLVLLLWRAPTGADFGTRSESTGT